MAASQYQEDRYAPPISYYLARARMADLRHDARRAAPARAARRTRPERCEHSTPKLHGLDRGVPALLGACGS
jgi:hypothetical protein